MQTLARVMDRYLELIVSPFACKLGVTGREYMAYSSEISSCGVTREDVPHINEGALTSVRSTTPQENVFMK
jgi:hypothetical protein